MGTLSPAFDKWGTICINSRRALITLSKHVPRLLGGDRRALPKHGKNTDPRDPRDPPRPSETAIVCTVVLVLVVYSCTGTRSSTSSTTVLVVLRPRWAGGSGRLRQREQQHQEQHQEQHQRPRSRSAAPENSSLLTKDFSEYRKNTLKCVGFVQNLRKSLVGGCMDTQNRKDLVLEFPTIWRIG